MKRFICLIFLLLFYSVATPNECVIVYGVYPDYRPYEWVEPNGAIVGINIDLLKALAKKADCSYRLEVHPWYTLVEKLKSGEITMISSSINADTFEYAVPLSTMFVQHRVLIGRKSATFVDKIELLKGKIVLLQHDGVAYNTLKRFGAEAEYRFIDSEQNSIKALSSGDGDYAFVDNTMNLLSGYPDLKIVSNPMFGTLYGFILAGSSPYYSRLSDAIDELKDGGEYYDLIDSTKRRRELIKILVFIATCLVAVVVLIIVWNKTLYNKVQEKTLSLRLKTEEHQAVSNLLSAIISNVPELLFIVDRNMNVVWASDKDVGSFNIMDIKGDLNIAFDNPTYEFSIEDSSGKLWKVLVTKFNHVIGGNFLVVVGDITENVRLRDELFMTARFSALGEMAAIIAHEINTPLGCIVHNVDYLFDFLQEGDEDITDAKKATLNSIDRIKLTIDGMKGYTSRQSKDYGVVDLRECIRTAVEISKFLINRSTNCFSMEMPKVECFVYGNYCQVEQMVINIIQNACYAVTDRQQQIVCKAYLDGGKIVLSIADEGHGMSEGVLKNACNPYFTTRSNSGGTGLGLSFSSRLIKEHGGYMEIKSSEGIGTNVSLFFPIYKDNYENTTS